MEYKEFEQSEYENMADAVIYEIGELPVNENIKT